MRIADLYNGEVLELAKQSVFMMDGEEVSRVRIHGVVVGRYDTPPDAKSRACYLTVDDGSETIRVKKWARGFSDAEDVEISDRQLLKDVEVGDIIDILGKVRKFNDELYVRGESITKHNNINWEMHRRSKLLEKEAEELDGLKPHADSPFPLDDQESVDQQQQEDEMEEDVEELILKVLREVDDTLSIEEISNRSGLTLEKTKEILTNLHHESRVLKPTGGEYRSIENI